MLVGYAMSTDDTPDDTPDVVRVSDQTYHDLTRIKQELGLNSLDQAMREAILRSPLGPDTQSEFDGADELKAK